MSGPVARNVVVRRRILDAFAAARESTVTLVCAPAGFGKSLAVATYLAETAPCAVVWVNFNSKCVDSEALWHTVVESIAAQFSDAELQRMSLLAMRSGAEIPQRLAAWVINRAQPLTLVFDDIHEVKDLDVHRQLVEFAVAASGPLRLIAISRHDPPWPLHRMRLDGMLSDIRPAELRFDAAEASELFEQIGHLLDDDVAQRLIERSQGWAAGLRLAALGAGRASEPREFIDNLTGRTGYVADYLLKEVYGVLPRRWQQFLVQISIVDEVCGDLGASLSGSPGAHSATTMLTELAEANAFIYEIGDRPGWYRLHPLLLDFLQGRIIDVTESTTLHRRAAEWFRLQNQPMVALRHALTAADYSVAEELVGVHIATWAICRPPRKLIAMLEQVPREVFFTYPGLAIGAAGARVMAGMTDDVEALLDGAQAQLDRASVEARPRYEFLIGLISTGLQRYVGGPAAVLAGLRELDVDPALLAELGLSDWPALRVVVLNNLGTAELWTDQREAAREHLTEAMSLGLDPRIVLPATNARAHLAYYHWERGDLSLASKLAHRTIEICTAAGMPDAFQTVVAHVVLAGIDWDRDDLDAAMGWLDRAGTLVCEPHIPVVIEAMRCRVATAQGDAVGAAARLRAVADATPDAVIPEPVRAQLADFDGALSRRSRARTSATASARVDGGVVDSRRERVLRGIEDALEQREDVECLATLEATIDLAADVQMLRPFLDASDDLSGALAALIEAGTRHSEFATHLLTRMSARRSSVAAPHSGLVVPLTDRELNILGYLVGSMPTAEIAAALFISVNTVKTHQRAVYRKLGVRDRRAAVHRARELGLL